MTDEKLAAVSATLQRPFLPNEIGKLPRGGIQLDYVGHADVTRRLLEADPTWNWEPLATDENGLPVYDTAQNGQPVGLWIKLTVGGVTRLGYGSVPGNQSDAVKVLIGDALRNAAMRFGVALDLWAKGDRADPTAENATSSAGQAVRGRQRESFENARPAPARPAGPRRVQPTAPAGAETDVDWLRHMVDDLIPAATTRDELLGHYDAVDQQMAAGKITDADAKDVRAYIEQRAADLGFKKASAA
jgi:hypothetical protein